MRKQKGFSLIELLIVVAIILIIAAIAIPNLMRARMAANESAAAAAVRTINTAQFEYQAKFQNTIGYAATLVDLGSPVAAACAPSASGLGGDCDIDSTLTTGTKGGYTFTMAVTTVGTLNTAYQVAAAPTTPNQTGSRWFCSYQDAVVRGKTTVLTPATCTGVVASI